MDKKSKVPWVVRTISESKGRGAFATRDYQAGEVIFEESSRMMYPSAVIKVPEKDQDDSSSDESSSDESVSDGSSPDAEALKHKVNALLHIWGKSKETVHNAWTGLHRPRGRNARYCVKRYRKSLELLSSSYNPRHYPKKKKLAKLFVAADCNSFETEDRRVIFLETSRLNHSCDPNVGYHTRIERQDRHEQGRWTGWAMRDIKEGEELCISYIQIYETKEKRQNDLKERWGFDCQCSRCEGVEDMRTSQINEVWEAYKGVLSGESSESRSDQSEGEIAQWNSDQSEDESAESQSDQSEEDEDRSVGVNLDEKKPDRSGSLIQLLDLICKPAIATLIINLHEASHFNILKAGRLQKEGRESALYTARDQIEEAKKLCAAIWAKEPHEMFKLISEEAAVVQAAVGKMKGTKKDAGEATTAL
ncbi:hypothetical protein F5Y16DRAFT_373323 [Xylariaceae sp. FL0255]|nr:hypothetical protein F5Y16DRAFT_373323 [Xylariaceae sp. FL0255]